MSDLVVSQVPGSSYPLIATPVPQQGGRLGDVWTSSLHGKYYTMALSGNLFHGLSAAAGNAVPITSTVNPVTCLWNPTGSGKNAVLVSLAMSYVSGTAAPGGWHLSYQTGVGGSLGTPISAFTKVAPLNALFPTGGNPTAMNWAPTTTTFAAGGTQGPAIGLSWETTTGATTSTPAFITGIIEFDGKFIIPPGVAVYPTAVAASVTLFTSCLTWYEAPTT